MAQASTSAPNTAVDSQINGASGAEGESSRRASTSADPSYHSLSLSSYIFNTGYNSQQWADVQITFFDQSIKLHRIVLSRSPFLAQIMANYQVGSSIHLNLPDDNVTPESVHIALRHLYQPSFDLVGPQNAQPVLATAYLFQGMPELAQHAYTILKSSISAERVVELVQWLNSAPRAGPETMFGSVSIQNGLATAPSSDSSEVWKEEEEGRYGEYSEMLRRDVMDFLIHTLPASPSNASLLQVYTQLPFDLFKQCVESPDLPISPTQARFAFAKKIIALRKKSVAASGMEENVVLSVSDDLGSVHVTRRPRRARTALWKVEG